MDSHKFADNKVYQILDFIMRLILLNLLTLTFSFPIFTAFPSIVASMDVIKQYANGSTTGVVGPFWTAFKKHFKKTFIISIAFAIVMLLLINSAVYFNEHIIEGPTYMVGYYLTLAIIFCLLTAFANFPLVLIYFNNLRLRDYVNLSFMFTRNDIAVTLGIVAITLGFAYLDFLLVLLFVVIGITLPGYLIIKISRKRYHQISKKYE